MHVKTSMQPHDWSNTTSATGAAAAANAQGSERVREEQRDPDSHYNIHRQSQNESAASFGSTSHLASIRWDNTEGSSSASIWSARQEDSTSLQSSYGSVGSSGRSSHSRLYGTERGIVAKMNDLSMSQQNQQQQQQQPLVSSLRMAANRYNHDSSSTIAPSGSTSVTSTGTSSIPGLTTAFSGSASQYSSSNYNPPSKKLFSAHTMPSGPPPGFLSPITTSSQRQASAAAEDLDTSVGSIGTTTRSFQSRRLSNQKNRTRGRNHNNSSSNSMHGTNDSIATHDSITLRSFKDPDSSLQSAFSMASSKTPIMSGVERPILPQANINTASTTTTTSTTWDVTTASTAADDSDEETGMKKNSWLLRMNRKLEEIPIGDLDPHVVPLSAIMNGWAKTKSSQGATMVEMWLNRAQEEYEAGNTRIVLTTKMYTMAGKK